MGTTAPSQIVSKEVWPASAPEEEEFNPEFEKGYEARKVYLDESFQNRLIRLIEGGCIHLAISLLFSEGEFVINRFVINMEEFSDVAKKMFSKLADCKDIYLLRSLIRNCYYFKPVEGFKVKNSPPVPVKIRKKKPKTFLVLETGSSYDNTTILVMLYNSF